MKAHSCVTQVEHVNDAVLLKCGCSFVQNTKMYIYIIYINANEYEYIYIYMQHNNNYSIMYTYIHKQKQFAIRWRVNALMRDNICATYFKIIKSSPATQYFLYMSLFDPVKEIFQYKCVFYSQTALTILPRICSFVKCWNKNAIVWGHFNLKFQKVFFFILCLYITWL